MPSSIKPFEGIDGTECEDFVFAVKQEVFENEKDQDDAWIARYVSPLMKGRALRWYERLDDEVQGSWKLLKRAMLDKFPPDDPSESSESSVSPSESGQPQRPARTAPIETIPTRSPQPLPAQTIVPQATSPPITQPTPLPPATTLFSPQPQPRPQPVPDPEPEPDATPELEADSISYFPTPKRVKSPQIRQPRSPRQVFSPPPKPKAEPIIHYIEQNGVLKYVTRASGDVLYVQNELTREGKLKVGPRETALKVQMSQGREDLHAIRLMNFAIPQFEWVALKWRSKVPKGQPGHWRAADLVAMTSDRTSSSDDTPGGDVRMTVWTQSANNALTPVWRHAHRGTRETLHLATHTTGAITVIPTDTLKGHFMGDLFFELV